MSSLADSFHSAPLDDDLRSGLESQGLQVSRVGDDDRAAADRWLDAMSRGFLDGERNDSQRAESFARSRYRRKVGVYDPQSVQPDEPVATFASWGADLTLPGGATVPMCAVSSVTVAPTHRRRGILSRVMRGELRTAVAQGFPIAGLTVSESGIYGRFGFAPAAAAATWEIATRRARWIGPEAPGRLDYVTREQGRDAAARLHERTRLASPGEIDMPGGHWDRFFGTRPDAEKAEKLRAVQYRSPDGEVDGVALYSVSENEDDWAASTANVVLLLAATDAAYAGLWRFLLSLDLIGTVRASELSVDEPLWWMIADQRAARIRIQDHQYLRILDVPATLQARTYDVDDVIALEVSDPLEIAAGTFVLSAGEEPGVDVVDDPPLGVPLVRLGVAELSAILLGGVSPVTLARAGRIETDDSHRVARVFSSTTTPRLSFWY
ncbi:GNAT family N-acetyltransferase [Microbacterium sp. EYE_5]|uniref:GNAT family N-acetyltransferase n=1 Tax=unclassified Microbacterium TaxID=2609290 RepID=UPI00200377ED|nr:MULTISPECIES: GNAT family N-acetyltransferase [unclassified Microbacterium]MCK6081139.1 GNAT family N-acetyltransferase [Microbacterium sp. EYE_382]MCK6086409.1 GNAT family N-acetyltransferase [Microbacterium sp. EYE_384]MCK6124093.1 GNAT family N-acetyltransferase [Microbacterium sp. EYE_80]MCK6127002.1 GNAT family N-acetyltransferase [Microbacterium sp. EYE_79]MCK6142094.1 GNAT family N-acetyltransferase [Microbacterium sp. EYE_39]